MIRVLNHVELGPDKEEPKAALFLFKQPTLQFSFLLRQCLFFHLKKQKTKEETDRSWGLVALFIN